MNRYYWFILLFVWGMVSCKSKDGSSDTDPVPTPSGPVVAFPGAAGGGSYATGGRDGYVFVVSNLEDNDIGSKEDMIPGSLRYALAQKVKRTIVFKVAGVIHLKSPLTIASGDLTILGQTAPGDGICIADYPVKIEKANNIIMQYIRIRMGDDKLTAEQADGADALSVNNCKNVLIDHCSFSWSTDECVSCYGNENFTMQYCFVTESLRKSKHDKGNHGYGGIWGGKNTTFHHNLLAHHDSRNPRFDHDYVEATNVGPVDFINNVVYNWGGNNCYGGECSSKTGNQRQYNFINNYYKPGPASGRRTQLLAPTTKCSNCTDKHGGTVVPGKFYVTGNIQTASASVTQDNWSGVNPDESSKKSLCKSDSRFTFTNCYTGEETADKAYETVLAKAGCSLKRDAVDTRIAQEVRDSSYTYTGSKSGTKGIIDTPSDVGGWPEYTGSKEDSDNDGMPDGWETAHGLNPKDRTDAVLKNLHSSYMNVEVYAQELVKNLY